MRHVILGLAAVSLLLVGGCATRTDLNAVQNDLEEMKTRLFRAEKELGGIRSEAKDTIDKSIKGVQADTETSRKSLADLQANMDSLKVDVNVLSGKADDLAILGKKPAEDIALLREDLERRLKAVDDRIAKTENRLAEIDKKLVDAAKPKEPEKVLPEALYQQGLDTYKAGKIKESRDLLTKFTEANPKHELVSNARYWIGETYYSEKNFEQAILEFQDVIKNYPGNNKAPAAMLKQAMAFKEIGDVKSARYVLKKLVDTHPTTDEAKKAKEKLAEFK